MKIEKVLFEKGKTTIEGVSIPSWLIALIILLVAVGFWFKSVWG